MSDRIARKYPDNRSGSGQVEGSAEIYTVSPPPGYSFIGAIEKELGDFIQWSTIGGDRYRGVIVEIEEGVAKVRCSDGVTRAVEV